MSQAPVLPGMFEQQVQELERVKGNLADAITVFWKRRVGGPPRDRLFYSADLYAWLERAHRKAAPGSPDRVLRDLKKRNQINYRLVSRSQSLYEAIPLEERQ